MRRTVCTKNMRRFHRHILIDDYFQFQLQTLEFQSVIRTGMDFQDWLQVSLLQLFVSTIVACW